MEGFGSKLSRISKQITSVKTIFGAFNPINFSFYIFFKFQILISHNFLKCSFYTTMGVLNGLIDWGHNRISGDSLKITLKMLHLGAIIWVFESENAKYLCMSYPKLACLLDVFSSSRNKRWILRKIQFLKLFAFVKKSE